jgi:hypothetical protein
MPITTVDGLRLSGFAWTFKLLPCKHTEISMRHARPFANTFRDQNMVSQKIKVKKLIWQKTALSKLSTWFHFKQPEMAYLIHE